MNHLSSLQANVNTADWPVFIHQELTKVYHLHTSDVRIRIRIQIQGFLAGFGFRLQIGESGFGFTKVGMKMGHVTLYGEWPMDRPVPLDFTISASTPQSLCDSTITALVQYDCIMVNFEPVQSLSRSD